MKNVSIIIACIAALVLLFAFVDNSKTLNFRRHYSHVEAAAHHSSKGFKHYVRFIYWVHSCLEWNSVQLLLILYELLPSVKELAVTHCLSVLLRGILIPRAVAQA